MSSKSKTLSYQKVFEKRLFFRYLLHLSNDPGVYALVNEKHKKVYINGSPDVVKSLGNIISQIATRIHTNKELIRDRKYLSIRMLEIGDYPFINKLKWIELYKANGYSIYNIEVLPIYKVKIQIVRHKMAVVTQVQLRSGGRKILRVKNFTTKKAAEEFVATTTVYDMLKMIKGDR